MSLLTEFAAKLGLDVDMTGFIKAQTAFEALKIGARALGRITRAVFDLGPEAADYAHTMEQASEITGVGVESFQGLAYAAGLSNVGVEELQHGLVFLSRNMMEASKGSKQAEQAFHALGIRATDAHGKLRPADEVFAQIADRFHAMEDGPRKAALAVEVFGRAGAQLVPLLRKGAKGIGELKQEASDLGLVLNKGAIGEGTEAEQGIKRMSGAWRGLKLTLGAELFPVLVEVTEAVTQFLRAHRADIATGFRIAIDAIRFAVKLLWMALWPVRVVLGFIADHMRVVAMVAGGVLLQAIWANISALGVLESGYVATAATAVSAAISTAAAWALALLPFAALMLIIDDLMVGLDPHGGKSVIIPAIKSLAVALMNAFSAFFEWFAHQIAWVIDKLEWVGKKLLGIASAVAGTIDVNEVEIPGGGGVTVGQHRREQEAYSAAPQAARNVIDYYSQYAGAHPGGDMPRTAPAAGRGNTTVTNHTKIEVHVPAGADAPEIARHVSKALDERDAKNARAVIVGAQ